MRGIDIAVIFAISVAGTLPATGASFTAGVVIPAGATVNDIVTDGTLAGTTIVGTGPGGGGSNEGFRIDGVDYTRLFDLPGSNSLANGVAGDASIVVGQSDAGGKHAVYWDTNDDIIVLTTAKSEANAVNFDGSTIVGKTKSGKLDTAVKWVIDGSGTITETILGDLGGGKSEAVGVSDDGNWVVGTGTNLSGDKVALMWDSGGAITEIGDLVGGKGSAVANDVNIDGTVVVGWADIAGGSEAFRWEAGVMVSLGTIGSGNSEATGVSADGSIVVGTSGNGANEEAFIWTEADGMRSLMEFLITEYGLGAELAGWTLDSATISADGQTVVGIGTNGGATQTFLAQIPEPSTYAMLMFGLVGLGWSGRRRRR
jgi:probable HAF family extracellular repeat protein